MRQVDRDQGLDSPARRHHDDAASDEDRLLDVVRHEQHCLFPGFPDAEQQLLHERARLVIERAERLVQEQDLGLVRERARDGRPLLHSAREHPRVVVLEAGEADPVDVVGGDLVLPRLRHSLLAQAVVMFCTSHGNNVALEHHAAVGARPRDGYRRAAPPSSAYRGRRRCGAASTSRNPTARGSL
jgi:hypothetical protein